MSTRTDLVWGIFRQRAEHGDIHVVPAYPDGTILEHHIVDVLCPCNPIPEPMGSGSNKIIVVHQEPGMVE